MPRRRTGIIATTLRRGALLVVLSTALVARTEEATTQPAYSDQSDPNSVTSPDWKSIAASDKDALFRLTELVAELGLEATYDRRSVSFDTENAFRLDYDQTNRAQRFEETIGARGAGSILGDRFLTFDAGARWGLSQERFVERRPGPDLDEDPHGDLLEYDVAMQLLPRGKISADAFASRQDSRVPRAFQPSLDRRRERYGGEVRFNDATLPMRLSFEHSDDDLSSRTRSISDDQETGVDVLRYEAEWQISDAHSLRLDYEYEDRSERYSGGESKFDTVRNYLTLNHALRFGEDRASSLETLGRFQDETGDLARDTAEVSSRLRLRHSETLETSAAVQYLKESYAELETETWRGEAGVTHRLGDTLTNVLQLYGLRQGADENADFSELGALASSNYSKENQWGRLSANLSYNRATTDFDDGGRTGLVLSEAVTFRDPLNAYLLRTDIDPLSIVVMNSERTRVYVSGRDYLALRFGRHTALRRIASGRIADRETVFVSYTYRIQVDRQVQRDRIDVRIQQDFEHGLTPYYAGSFQFEDVDSGGGRPYLERDIHRHRVGATFRRQRWSVGLEYEYHDDSIDPYQAVHLNADATVWQAAIGQVDARLSASQFRFEGARDLPRRDAFVLDAGASARAVLMRDLDATASAMYRYEDDDSFGITHGVDLTAGLQWRIGLFALSLDVEYDVLRLPGSRDDGLSVWMKLRREIPLLADGGQR